jgi:hypothetical protein
VDVGNFVVRRAGVGELIVDGTITGTRASIIDLSTIQATFGGGADKTVADQKGVRVYDGSSDIRVGLGDISGLLYGSSGLASGTFGLYVRGGGAFLTDYPRVITKVTATGSSTFTVAAGASYADFIILNATVPSQSIVAGRSGMILNTLEKLVVTTSNGPVLEGWSVNNFWLLGGVTQASGSTAAGAITFDEVNFNIQFRVRNTSGSSVTATVEVKVSGLVLDVP